MFRKRLWSTITLAAVVLLLFAVYVGSRSADRAKASGSAREQLAAQKYLQDMQEVRADAILTQGSDVLIPAASFAEKEGGGIETTQGLGGIDHETLSWNSEEGSVSWNVDVPATGLYEIDFRYYPLIGRDGNILRTIAIDGSPVPGVDLLSWQRIWVDDGPMYVDDQGNEMAPPQKEKQEWRWTSLEDANKRTPGVTAVNLTAGRHVLTLSAVQEPVALDQIRLRPYSPLPTYQEIAETYQAEGKTQVTDIVLKVQAESIFEKSDPVVHALNDNNALSEPQDVWATKMNTIGGSAWKKPGQSASWQIHVTEPGLYQIGMRYGQFFHRGVPSFRSIRIDGRIPFLEMQMYAFPYNSQWAFTWLSDAESGKPFEFYLTAGTHTLSMDVELGPVGTALTTIEQTTRRLGELHRDIIMITGVEPDPNLDYDLEIRMPNLVAEIDRLADKLDAVHMQLKSQLGLSGNASELATLKIAIADLRDLVMHQDNIPKRLSVLLDAQSVLATWLLTASDQPLQLDYFLIASAGTKEPVASPSFIKNVWHGTSNFFISFVKNYNDVGTRFETDNQDASVLNVWVGRGRAWAEVMKRLADVDFTRKTGIRINMTTFPAGDTQLLLLSSASGSVPDVALGMPNAIPVDYAIRGVLADMTKFPDYDEVAERFQPGMLTPFKYNGGAYAIPETQDFTMLFYRKDILDELGLKVPQTWEDVYAMLPVLQRKGLNFGYPFNAANVNTIDIGGYTTFLFQNEGSYYADDGKRSGLDSPQAIQAFKEWTRMYRNYRVPQELDFFNHFRIGDIPIGVSNYNSYVLLSTAAPELRGLWSIAEIPGTPQPDGTVNHAAGGGSESGVIFSASSNKDAAWQFLKWWTSTETQTRFGREIESILGAEARWNTANLDAMKRLPWPKDDLFGILKQWDSFQELPVVPGGYYTSRYLMNAWNETVLSGKNPREALDDAVREINKELTNKRKEFDLPYDK